ncbi:hypothetical protein K523DRAFT_422489 [Schizophyllum commune Tattone D]|nr:hypothetical protein K523DRAFT_422489 [Schizophyllum commune Tattone D]
MKASHSLSLIHQSQQLLGSLLQQQPVKAAYCNYWLVGVSPATADASSTVAVVDVPAITTSALAAARRARSRPRVT